MKDKEVNKDCDHEWVVFSTAIEEVCLMVQCVRCGAHGSVDDPAKAEWQEAVSAPSRPYRWHESDRVNIRGMMPEGQWYVQKKPMAEAEEVNHG